MLTKFIRKRVQRELDAAKNPKGMSLHSGKVTLEICDVERMLLSAAPTPPEVEPVFFVSPGDIEKVLHRDIGAGIFAARIKVGVNTTPLYTSPPSPADDELRKAAAEVLRISDIEIDNDELLNWSKKMERAIENLRAALNKVQS